MAEGKFIEISKLDAARRQLEHAVKLFFHFGDPVVIRTLTAAGSQILRDLAHKQGIESVLHDEMFRHIKPERIDEVKQILSGPENYFKHADRDSNKLLKFYPDSTEFEIWDACMVYQRLTKETLPIFYLYQLWFSIKNAPILLNEELKKILGTIKTTLNVENRLEYWALLPEIEKRLLGQQ